MKTRGLVLELEPNEAVIMAETGEFIICNPRPEMAVGSVVEVALWDRKRFYRDLNIGLSGAAVFIFGLLMGFGLFFNQINKVYAYMDVDFSSSLALSLNRELKVTEVRALSREAGRWLKKEELAGKSVRDVLPLLVRRNQDQVKGLVNPDVILVAVALQKPGKKVRQEEEQQFLRRIGCCLPARIPLANHKAVSVKTLEVSASDGRTARQMGISMGKYYLYRKARQMGAKLTLKEARALSGSTLVYKLLQVEAGIMPGRIRPRQSRRKPELPKARNGNGVTSSEETAVDSVADITDVSRVEGKGSRKAGKRSDKVARNQDSDEDEEPTGTKNVKAKKIPGFRLFSGGSSAGNSHSANANQKKDRDEDDSFNATGKSENNKWRAESGSGRHNGSNSSNESGNSQSTSKGDNGSGKTRP